MIKKRIRRFLSVLLTVMLTLSCFCSCGNGSAIDEEIDTSPLPAGMTFSDVCGLLYIGGKQVNLPCSFDDLLTFDDRAYKLGVHEIRFRNATKSTILYDLSHGQTERARYDAVMVMTYEKQAGESVFSINGTVKIGDDLSRIKEILGEPTTDTHGLYVNSGTYLWYAFKDNDSLIRLHFTADDNGKLDGVLMLRTDWYKL